MGCLEQVSVEDSLEVTLSPPTRAGERQQKSRYGSQTACGRKTSLSRAFRQYQCSTGASFSVGESARGSLLPEAKSVLKTRLSGISRSGTSRAPSRCAPAKR